MEYKNCGAKTQIGNMSFYNCDNMLLLKETPDKYYELAIVDPPYGAFNIDNKITRTGGSWSAKYQIDNSIKNWDFIPLKEYFDDLFRVSKNQIIWGGNYFTEFLPNNRHFIIWEKTTISESFSMAMVEYAWSSFNENAKLFKYRPQNKERIHPTEKPIALYKFLLEKYAKPNDKILDTHLGSGSIAIACHDLGFNLTATELDKDYFDSAMHRLKMHTNSDYKIADTLIKTGQTDLF